MPIQDTDLFLVSRGGTNYKATGEDIKDYAGGGGGEANPQPGDTSATPNFDGGSGTTTTPYTITPSLVNIGGATQSAQLVSFTGLVPGSRVVFTDLNAATNGSRFSQPTGVVSEAGVYTCRLQFVDNPPTTGGGTYTAKLKVGTSSVYFEWKVTVEGSGVLTPTIQQIQDISGTFYDAPTSPGFVTGTQVGAVAPVSALSNLDPDSSSPILSPTGGGSLLQIRVSTTGNGNIGSVEIINPGVGYTYGGEITVDLSSVGGGSAVPFYTYTQPCTGAVGVFKVTAFEAFNAGSFAEAEWEFATEPTFTFKETVVITTVGTTMSVSTKVGPNKPYYARFRYKSTTGVYSEYSPVVRSATGAMVQVEYILKQFSLSGGQVSGVGTFDSDPFYISPRPFTYLVVVNNLNPAENTYTKNPPVGVACQGAEVAGQPFTGGQKTQIPAAVYLQLRQPAYFTVTQIGSGGSIADVEQTNLAYGLNDYYNLVNGAPVSGGSGNGGRLLLKRGLSGETLFDSVSSAGTGYQVGDILMFKGPIGNGCNGAPQSVVSVTGFSTLTLDSYWDVLLQGVASRGAWNPGGNQDTFNGVGGNVDGNGGNGTGCTSSNGGIRNYSLYPAYTGSMVAQKYSSFYQCAGGGGWAPGVRCSAAITENAAGGNGAGYVNDLFLPSWYIRSTTYADPRTVDVYVNSALAGTVGKEVKSFRLS